MKNDHSMSKYWNPYLETLEPEKLKYLQFIRFKEIFTHAYNNSPLYREFYDSHGVSPDSIREMGDIEKAPIVGKLFFESKVKDSLYGDSLAVPPEEVVRFHHTSGTTHHPLRQPDTLEDWNWWAECWATVLWGQGIRPDDRVLFPFNYGAFIGFWSAHYGCEKVGTEIISTGGLSTKERVQKIVELKPTVLITTPTYAFRMLEVARDVLQLDMAKSTVKTIVLAGEPGALVPSTKKELETRWGSKILDNIGATEVGTWGFECNEDPGGIHINEHMFHFEIIDLDSGKMITEPHKHGKLIITAFYRKGRPCIRFDTRDLACWDNKYCTCGRTLRLLKGGIQGRTDHLMKIRGTFVTPAVIENIIRSDNRLSPEYQVIIGKKNRASLTLAVEVNPNVSMEQWDDIKANLAEKIHYNTNLRFEITLNKYGEISRGMFKSKRFIDLR